MSTDFPKGAMGCDTPRTTSTVAGMESGLGAYGGVVLGNVRLASSCMSEAASQCRVELACGTSAGCVGAVLTTPPPLADLGFADLVGSGWKLRDGGPCAFLRGGADLVASVPADAYGTPRTAPVSIGAHENDAACQ